MAQYLNKQQRTFLIRFLVFLGLVRWYNLLVIALAQLLAAVFILNKDLTWQEVLKDPGLYALVCSSLFIIAGGYLINAFYDWEKDLVNRPRAMVLGRFISKHFALNCYFLFSFTGLLTGILLSYKVFIFHGIFVFLLWFYSHKLKKITFVGNLTATFLTVCSFFVVCVYYWQVNYIIIFYVLFIIITELIRELVKDLEAIKGDVIFGYDTVPVAWGIPKTKLLITSLMVTSLVPGALISWLIGSGPILYFFAVAYFLLLITATLLLKAQSRHDFSRVNQLLKLILGLGILSIALL